MRCDQCEDTGLVRQEDETLALCPGCRVINLSERRNKKRQGITCIRLPVKDMYGLSWCGRELGAEPAFRDVDHAVTDALNRTGRSACPSCLVAVKAALRIRA
jgi:hypothetical protein